MKLIDIVWKEISLVKAQKIAILLIILYPLLAVGLLGSSFSGIDLAKVNQVKIGFVNSLGFDSAEINNFLNYEDLSIIQLDSEQALLRAIKNNEVIVGLMISGGSENEQLKVNLYYDNSNLLSSRFFMEIAKAMMQRITIQIAQNRLSEVWTTMSLLGNNLDSEINNISDFKAQLQEANTSLLELEKKLNQFDVDSYENKADDFQTKMNEMEDSFYEAKSEYDSLRQKSIQYEASIESMPEKMIYASSALLAASQQISSVAEVLPEGEEKSKLLEAKNEIDSQKNSVDSMHSTVLDILEITQEINSQQSEINTAFDDAENLFEEASLGTADLESLLSAVEDVKTLVVEAKKSKTEIEEKLNSSHTLLSGFGEQIIKFKGIDPKVLAQPVIFYEKKVFNVDPFGILVSNSMVIVLVLTCMLLTAIIVILERNENVSLRLKMCPTSEQTILSGKIIGQLLIALLEAGIIFAVAFIKIPLPFEIAGIKSIGFGLITNASPLELVFAVILIALCFISLGLLIASFAKTQSTAILTTLLLVVPMLFLSGIILPLEFMEPTMQIISSLLPLTIANELLIGLIIKNLSILELGKEIILLIGYSAIALIAVNLKKE